MSGMRAVLIFTAAAAIPAWLLYRVGTFRWYWHLAAVAVALAIGLAPRPAALANPVSDLLTGAAFLFLLVWGVGGVLLFRPHETKHRERHA